MAKTSISSAAFADTKPHYEILDGLRGVAALLVVFYHIFEGLSFAAGGTLITTINHGYLAVDFFFILSGFVIGYAYDDRLRKSMTLGNFFKRRLIRLHPMILMGAVIGAISFCVQGCVRWDGEHVAISMVMLALLCAMFFIPATPGSGYDVRGNGEMFPLNGPSWSLFFEYIGNILYALIFRKLPTAILAVLCLCSAFLTMNLALGWDVFGIFDSDPQYNIIGGWSLEGPQIFIGFTRLLYPFICGLLISRLLRGRMSPENPGGSPLHIKGGFWWASLILAVVFAIPCIGGRQCLADGIYQAVAIIVIFPAVVLIGAGSVTTGAVSSKICRFLGEISYPLYITHFPLVCMQVAWVSRNNDAPLWMHIAVSAGVLVFAVACAWAWLKLYDGPVRKWLTDKWLKHSNKQ